MLTERAGLMTDATVRAVADLERLYDLHEPRAYHRALHALGYRLPQGACAAVLGMASSIGTDRRLTVLDFGRGYRVNGALLK